MAVGSLFEPQSRTMSDKLTEAKEAGGGTVERRLQELSEGTVYDPVEERDVVRKIDIMQVTCP